MLAAALTSCALLLSSETRAQQQEPTAPQSSSAQQGVEEVVVTGSRIVRSGMQTPTPVTAVTSTQLSHLDPGNMVDALSQLPQFLNNTDAVHRSNFLTPAGGAFLNVRGLGTNRTLTLLDGHRVPPTDRNSTVDTNMFPEPLVQRVEVVTGGASAAYGADALSGVVNFILNTNYEGFDAKVQGGATNYHDGQNWKASFTGGIPIGEKLHLTFSGQEFRQDEVQGYPSGIDPRTWYQHWGYVTNPAYSASDPPGTNPRMLVLPYVHSTEFTPGGKINQPGFLYDGYEFVGDGTQIQPYVPGTPAAINTGTLSTSGGPGYAVANLGERSILGAEVRTVDGFANIDYDINDGTKFFFRAMTGENYAYQHDVNGGLGPSLMGIWRATIYADNAFLPDSVRQAMQDAGLTSFRMDKNGALPGRNNYADHYTDGTEIIQRVLSAGLDHKLSNDWTLSAFLQTGRSDKENLLTGDLRIDREFLAMDAVEVYKDRRDGNGDGLPDLVSTADRGTGDVICNVQRYNPTVQQLADSVKDVLVPSPQGEVHIASPVGLDNTIAGCVPLNIFGYGNVSPAAQQYLATDKWAKSYVTQQFAELTVSGDVFKNWHDGGVSFTLGTNYRKEKMAQTEYPRGIAVLGPPQNAPDLGIRGISPGFTGGSPNLNQFSSLSTFSGDFDVTEVFGETLVPLLKRLNLNLAARLSDYSRAGRLTTWKFGLDSQLTQSFRLRGTLSEDAREATFEELFDLNGGGGNVNDPAFGGNTFSITVDSGGNPNLKPEQARTYTFGFVYQPQHLTGLGLSIDYYSIDLSSTIGSLGTQRIVDDCYNNNVQSECALIHRDPGTNIITFVSNVLVNIDAAKVSGTDIELTYRGQTHMGNGSQSIGLRFLAGYLGENSQTPLGGTRLDYAGTNSGAGGGNLPKWTTTTSVDFAAGPWSANLQHRWIDSTKTNPLYVAGVDVDNNTIAAVDYTNLGMAYTHDTPKGGSWRAFLNIVNAFDAHPPPIPTNVGRSIAGSTGVSSHYAIMLGRRYTLGLEYKF